MLQSAELNTGPDLFMLMLPGAECRVFKVLENCAQRLQRPHRLLYMGFTTDFGSGLPSSISVGHDKVIDNYELAEHATTIWRNCAKHRIGSMVFHFVCWIGLFARSASDDETYWHLCVRHIRVHDRALLNACRHTGKSAFLKQVVDASPFLSVMMQDLVDLVTVPGIQKKDFIIKKFRAYAVSIFNSWGQTKVVEDNFQIMRQREMFDTKNKTHAPCIYWAMAREMEAI